MGQTCRELELQRDILGGLTQEAGDGFGDNATLLGPGPAFDEHLQVELFGGQAFQGILTDGPEPSFVDIFQKTLFQVGISKLHRIVFPKDAFDMGGGKNFPHDIEDGIVIQGIPDFLELFQEPLQDPAFDGIRGHEVEDEAVLALAITMNTAHTLFKAVGVPGNIIVEKDMATLQVDTFPGGLGGHQNLDGSFPELLFGVKTGAGFIPGAWLHAAMDETDLEAPCFKFSTR